MKFPRAKPRERFKYDLKALSDLREGFKWDLMALPELRGQFKRHLMPLPELRGHFKRHLRVLPKLREGFKCYLMPLPELREHFKCDLRALSSQRDALLNEFCLAKLARISILYSKFVISMSERGVLGCNPKPCWEKVRAWERKNPASEVEGFPSPK